MNEMPRGYCNCGPFRVDIVPKGLLKPLVLKLLSERPMHGFELMEQIFEKTNGMWRPGPAAIYPTLEWLEANGDKLFILITEVFPRSVLKAID